jgi:hypothetical protein
MTEKFAALISGLPERSQYCRAELLRPELKVAEQPPSPLTMYYAPFDFINVAAKVALVGVTPGWTQMEISYRAARRALLAGKSMDDADREAKRAAAFGGSMRDVLVGMLDELDLPALLRLRSSDDLFESDLLHATSAIRYPVFMGNLNYTGSKPPLWSSPWLEQFARRVLVPELCAVGAPVVVPLGRMVEKLLATLEADGSIPAGRLLRGFPHPSRANGHRKQQFAANQAEMRKRLKEALS